MPTLLDKIETKLNIPKETIIEYSAKKFLQDEIRNITIEIFNIATKYGVRSFNELWNKIEKGEITEEECFNDLTRLEYLELRKEEINKILEER